MLREKKKRGGEGSQKSCSSEKVVIRVLGNVHLGTAIKGCGGNFLAMADCLEVLSKCFLSRSSRKKAQT